MPQEKEKAKGGRQQPSRHLSLGETKRILDEYIRYRFGQQPNPQDVADKAGVNPDVIGGLLNQQPVDEADLSKVAKSLGLSVMLLRQICGLEDISLDTLDSINRFMSQAFHEREPQAGKLKVREAGKQKEREAGK